MFLNYNYMNFIRIFLLFIFSFFLHNVHAQFSFKIIPLGVLGGGDESNLSSYMAAPENSENYICLDAGTIRFGIQQAINNNLFPGNAVSVLRTNVKAYLISHPHLDHVAGLIINS